jgi:hypothetical protein
MTVPVQGPAALALRLAQLLIDTIQLAPSRWCRDTVSDLVPLMDAATAALLPGSPISPHEVRHAADRLASSLFLRFPREGARGAWPVEAQLPYDAATTIRRACETNALALLPLIIRDVRSVLERARANPERVDAIVAQTRAADS